MAVKGMRPLRVQTKERGGKITTAGRRALSKEQFALPDGERPGVKGRFPMDTKARARNALARGAQALKRGTITPGQLATIRRRVKAKYPGIDVTQKKK